MSKSKELQNLAIVGGGAAGFFTGVNAAQKHPRLKVTIFEKSREVMSKVRISGGGRCNVTHYCFDPEILAQAYPRGGQQLRWAFEQFDAQDTVNWFEERNVELKTESDGRMFPITDDSATIINCLKKAANNHNVTVHTRTRVDTVTQTERGRYKLSIRNEDPQIFEAVVIATGGSNRKKTYQWLKKLDHSIVEPVPSLFTFNFKNHVFEDLSGISVQGCSVAIKNTSFQHDGPILITHWGLSGPAVLKTSSWAARYLYAQDYHFDIKVNWLHPKNTNQIRTKLKTLREENAKRIVRNQDIFELPNRLWERFLKLSDIDQEKRWAELSNKQIHELSKTLTARDYEIKGKTTYKDEFVTSGGIPLDEVNMGTMESKKSPNIFFVGEVLNIDGITGGYNFQSAWTTGWIAAQNIAES